MTKTAQKLIQKFGEFRMVTSFKFIRLTQSIGSVLGFDKGIPQKPIQHHTFLRSFLCNSFHLGTLGPLHRLCNVSINRSCCKRRVLWSTWLEKWNQMDAKNGIIFIAIGLVRDPTTTQTNTTIHQNVHQRLCTVGASTPIERIEE